MFKNFSLDTIILIFAILAGNWFICSFIFVNLKKYFSVLINNLKKKLFVLTFLIASNPLRLTSSESNVSQNFSTSSSDSSISQTLVSSSDSSISQSTSATSLTSSNTSLFEGILNNNNLLNLSLEQVEAIMTPTTTSILSNAGTSNMETLILVQFTSEESRTILNSQSYYEWRELVLDLHQHPINTPAGILQQIKLEELNILYSEDILHFALTQTDLRLLIELLPAMSLFEPDINHLILTMMSYYH